MVTSTQQDKVVQRSGAAIGPMDQVMGIGPAGRTVAAVGNATAISNGQGSTGGGWHCPSAPSDVERFALALGDDPAETGVTCQSAGGLRSDDAGVVQLAGMPGPSLQSGHIDGERDVGALPAQPGRISGVKVVPTDVDKGVGVALRGCAAVGVVESCGL